MTHPTSPKDVLLQLLDQGLVMLHINARHPDTIVPSHLKDDLHLRLNLSYRFKLPDLHVEDTGVSATLSFQRQPFHCTIPFSALWGLSQPHDPENLIIFPDALPIEMLALAIQAQQGDEDDEGNEALPPLPNPAAQPAPIAQPAPAAQPMSAHAPDVQDKKTAPPRNTKRPALQLVVDHEREESSSDEAPPSPTKRPSLRLIKGKDD